MSGGKWRTLAKQFPDEMQGKSAWPRLQTPKAGGW
jgi:hypothetical protein